MENPYDKLSDGSLKNGSTIFAPKEVITKISEIMENKNAFTNTTVIKEKEQINPFNNKIMLDGNVIRWKKEPNALFLNLNLFKGRKIAKFYDHEEAIKAFFQLNRPEYR